MKNMTRLGLIILSALFLVACASIPLSAPKRTAYTGEDRVTAIDAKKFIGSWSIKILNPVKGEVRQKTTATYKADGTVVIQMNNTNTGSSMTDIILEATGTWQVNGEVITQKLESIRETSGNKFAGMMTGLISGMKNRLSGTANVYILEANRIVVVGEDAQHQVQELTRIR